MRSSAWLLDSTIEYPGGEQKGYSDYLASDAQYGIRLAKSAVDVRSALRLRNQVFSLEIGTTGTSTGDLEWDEFDFRSKHLLAIDKTTGKTVGTYRINSVASIADLDSLYSAAEFEVGNLPTDVILKGVEIGRACIDERHRGSKALFLLWKGLGKYLVARRKRYVFGCCSIFTKDPTVGVAAHRKLVLRDAIHPTYKVLPKNGAIDVNDEITAEVELPHLFEMYLKLGAKVCGPPMYDAAFGSVDFFVLFDLKQMSDRYRRILLQ